jgi:DNA-binding NarL/FixJ family response regulator
MLAKDLLDPLLHGGRPVGQARVQLTLRQREVLQLVAEGRSLKEIASILCVSVKTVEFHKTRIVKQLGVHSTADLTRYAMTHGLVSS